jgi:hypothetical protein
MGSAISLLGGPQNKLAGWLELMKFLGGPISPARASLSNIHLPGKAMLLNEPMLALRANLDEVSKALNRHPNNCAHSPAEPRRAPGRRL